MDSENFGEKNNYSTFVGIVLFIALLFLSQIGIGYLIIQQSTLARFHLQLANLTSRVQKDLTFKNGEWDMERYLSDPQTPHPNGSSGFSDPLYIVTTDGFVIERNLPISGYLDDSNFKELLAFDTPKTIISPTRESWRVLSQPIMKNGEKLGVIVVSNYNPSTSGFESIDAELQKTLKVISSKISVNNGGVDGNQIDASLIPYNISFEIVNKYNKVLLNNGRTPSLIDPSYVFDQTKKPSTQIIHSALNQEQFLIKTQILKNGTNSEGLIVVGKSLSDLNILLKNYVILSLLCAGILIIPVSFFLTYLLHYLKTRNKKLPQQTVESIQFDKTLSIIQINQNKISIPYASNQYYVLKTLLTSPTKRFEQDVLLEVLGEDPEKKNQRKIYDAMLAVNKKVKIKLIIYDDKTYFLNPTFSKLSNLK